MEIKAFSSYKLYFVFHKLSIFFFQIQIQKKNSNVFKLDNLK